MTTSLETMTLYGDTVSYHDTDGDGPVVVLVHGLGSSARTWRRLIPELSEHFRVIAPDLVGHGQSAKPRTDYSLGAVAVWLRDFLQELGIARMTLVGHSFGGGVGMQFVHQHPEMCERLVLISSGGLGPDVAWMLRMLAAPGAGLIAPLVASPPVLALGDRMNAWLAKRSGSSGPTTDNWETFCSLADPASRRAFLCTLRSVVDHRGQSISALGRLHTLSGLPTMIVWGEHDPILPVSHAYSAHAHLPDSRMVTLAGIGHVPQLAAPLEVARHLVDFLSTTEPWSSRRRFPVARPEIVASHGGV